MTKRFRARPGGRFGDAPVNRSDDHDPTQEYDEDDAENY